MHGRVNTLAYLRLFTGAGVDPLIEKVSCRISSRTGFLQPDMAGNAFLKVLSYREGFSLVSIAVMILPDFRA